MLLQVFQGVMVLGYEASQLHLKVILLMPRPVPPRSTRPAPPRRDAPLLWHPRCAATEGTLRCAVLGLT